MYWEGGGGKSPPSPPPKYMLYSLVHIHNSCTQQAIFYVRTSVLPGVLIQHFTEQCSILSLCSTFEHDWQDKVKAAVSLLSRLHSRKPSLVGAMERLCEAYIDLAYHDVSAFKKQRRPIKLPSGCPLLKLARMKEVAMPTMEIEVADRINVHVHVFLCEYQNHPAGYMYISPNLQLFA